MDEKTQKEFEVFIRETMNDAVKQNEEAVKEALAKELGTEVANQMAAAVKQMRMERFAEGKSPFIMSEDERKAFSADIKSIALGTTSEKTLLRDTDASGGYTVPTEVEKEIFRIAETSGYILGQATKLPISSKIDLVTSSSTLEGAYYDEDNDISEETITFGKVALDPKVWGTIVLLSETLLKDSAADITDYVIGLIGEGLATKTDKKGFGTGSFTTGLLGSGGGVSAVTMATGETAFTDIDYDDLIDMQTSVAQSVLSDAGYYFHRSVIGVLKKLKDSTGRPLLNSVDGNMFNTAGRSGLSPVAFFDGYPVYSVDVLPAVSATAVNTNFGFFGSIRKAVVVGLRNGMEIEQSNSATVGSEKTFQKYQRALRAIHRHDIGVALPAAGVVIKTAAS